MTGNTGDSVGPRWARDRLTEDEIRELARLFPSPHEASRVLSDAGLPLARQPPMPVAADPEALWREIADLAAYGAPRDGRRLVLEAALMRVLANSVLLRGRAAMRSRPRDVEEAYRVHQADLLRFVRRCAAGRRLSEAQVDTEGIVQETFALATRYWDTIDDPPAWLFTVARRLMEGRSLRITYSTVADDGTTLDRPAARWSTVVPRASPEDARAAREVVAAIVLLKSDRQRVATYLRHVQGWSLAEIAELLDCSASTAGVHVHNGVRHIRADVAERPGWGESAAGADWQLSRPTYWGFYRLRGLAAAVVAALVVAVAVVAVVAGKVSVEEVIVGAFLGLLGCALLYAVLIVIRFGVRAAGSALRRLARRPRR